MQVGWDEENIQIEFLIGTQHVSVVIWLAKYYFSWSVSVGVTVKAIAGDSLRMTVSQTSAYLRTRILSSTSVMSVDGVYLGNLPFW